MRGDPPPIARLREQLVENVRAPLTVSPTSNQHYFDEDHAAYCEIEVRRGEAFIAVVVLGALPSEDFVVRVWHRYAEEVWLVDRAEQVVFLVPRSGAIRVFAVGEVAKSAWLPGVEISVSTIFGVVN